MKNVWKQEAERLIDLFVDASIVEEEENYYHPRPYSLGVQCALVAVREIVKVTHSDSRSNSRLDKEYWQKVEKELENYEL